MLSVQSKRFVRLVGKCVLTRSVSDKRGRRVLFNVPGSDERKINKALGLDLDVVVLDIEDGVARNRKQEARELILKTYQTATFPSHTEKAIRMNHVGSSLEHDDLKHTVIPCLQQDVPLIDSIVMTKVETPQQLQFIGEQLLAAKVKHNVELIAAIESAKGFINLKEICEADLPDSIRLTGLIYASEDLCADMGITRTSSRKELLYTRQSLVCHAKAYKLDAIDLVCIQFKDEEVLVEEAIEGNQMGFTGKQAIHPNQIQPIYRCFAPSPQKVAFATKIIEQFELHVQEGKGACEVDGVMIDLPMVKWAKGVLLSSVQQ